MTRIDAKALNRLVDLPRLVGQYVSLRKKGQSWQGLCPFHDERDASFKVTGNSWRCFGCNTHGDAIDFVMAYHKLDFPQACKWLKDWGGFSLPLENAPPPLRGVSSANSAGVSVTRSTPRTEEQDGPTGGSRSNSMDERAKEIARVRSSCRPLPMHHEGTEKARPGADYLLKVRGISQRTAFVSGVLFHPRWLEHPRLVFQIRRPLDGDYEGAGEIVALQGRAITPNADKEYRLRCAGRKAEGAFWTPGAWSQDVIILTEGEIEALTFAECGFPAVATCGAGNHAPWLAEGCRGRDVIIAFDDDGTGKDEANKLADLLSAGGARVSDELLLPPEGCHADGKAYDWNDWLVKCGREAVAAVIRATLYPNQESPGAQNTTPVVAVGARVRDLWQRWQGTVTAYHAPSDDMPGGWVEYLTDDGQHGGVDMRYLCDQHGKPFYPANGYFPVTPFEREAIQKGLNDRSRASRSPRQE